MASDSIFSIGPSDSELLDASLAAELSAKAKRPGAVPNRAEYVEPKPAEVDASAPEESLREVPLPPGFMSRLRRSVRDL